MHTYADALLGGLFTLAAASAVGVASIELFDIQFGDVLVALGGIDVTIATALSLAVMLAAWVVNKPTWGSLGSERQMFIGATVAIIALATISSSFTDFVAGSSLWGLAVVGIEAGGYYAISQSNSR
jgi:hypothetical protein